MIIQTHDTEYSADAVEFCPFQPFDDIAAVGTYQVVEHQIKTVRTGRIWLYNVSNSLKYHLDCDAILDLKWSKLKHMPILGAVTSTGNTILYRLNQEQLAEELKIPNQKDALNLSMDWSNKLHHL
jgi:diphthamide biosynthesis protein 7